MGLELGDSIQVTVGIVLVFSIGVMVRLYYVIHFYELRIFAVKHSLFWKIDPLALRREQRRVLVTHKVLLLIVVVFMIQIFGKIRSRLPIARPKLQAFIFHAGDAIEQIGTASIVGPKSNVQVQNSILVFLRIAKTHGQPDAPISKTDPQ